MSDEYYDEYEHPDLLDKLGEHELADLLGKLKDQRWLYAVYSDAGTLHDALRGYGIEGGVLWAIWGGGCILLGAAAFAFDGMAIFLALACFFIFFALPFLCGELPSKMLRNIHQQRADLMRWSKETMDPATFAILKKWYATSSLTDPFDAQKQAWEREYKDLGIGLRVRCLVAALFNDPSPILALRLLNVTPS